MAKYLIVVMGEDKERGNLAVEKLKKVVRQWDIIGYCKADVGPGKKGELQPWRYIQVDVEDENDLKALCRPALDPSRLDGEGQPYLMTAKKKCCVPALMGALLSSDWKNPTVIDFSTFNPTEKNG